MRFLTLFLCVLALAVPAFAQANDDSEKPMDTTTLVWPTEFSTKPDPAWADNPTTSITDTSAMDGTEAPQTSDAVSSTDSTPDEVLVTFMAGNESATVYDSAHPSAVVIECAESMPDPHIIFGQPQGRIAVVRNMGNTLPLAGLQPDSVDTGSIEYAVMNQGARLIIVLGHKNCDVMKTVVGKWDEIKGKVSPAQGQGKQLPKANLGAVYQVLYPAVTKANRDGESDILDASVRNNVANTVAGLAGDTFAFSKLVKSGELVIVGAVYDPETKKVELLK